MLDIYVISLLRSEKRRKNVLKAFSDNNLSFSFIDAVDGREGKDPLLNRFKPKKFLSRHGRPHMPGEAGCYASHFLAWKKCVEINKPIIIFEDDFIFNEKAAEIISILSSLIGKYGFIRLEDDKLDFEKKIYEKDGITLVRHLRIPQRMTCYAVSPEAAERLIAASAEFVYPVDVFVRHQNIHKVPIYGIRPWLARPEDAFSEDSEIGDRHKDKGPIWCKITKLIFKIKNTVLNMIRNIEIEIADIFKK